MASGLTAQQNGSATNTVSTLNAMALDGEIGKRAVENNFFHYTPEQLNDMAEMAEAKELVDEAEKEAKTNIGEEAIEAGKDAIDRGVPHYILVEGGFYKYSAKLAVNTRNGDLFIGSGMNPIDLPASAKLSLSAQTGWIANLNSYELRDNLPKTISNTLEGSSIGASVCRVGCISSSRTILTDNPKYLFGIGLGGGVAVGADRLKKIGE
ncbi:hypothetical protein ACLSY8_07870 [Avibacterium avium]|uniref:hypothetical protein n=1 Tax=Avibacterium TaxID=292486 RepID=UPI003BF792AE